MSEARESLDAARTSPGRVCPNPQCNGNRLTWLAECGCGTPTVAPTVHLTREHRTRPGSWRIICGESLRASGAFRVGEDDADEVNCLDCRAILDREARAAA